MIIRDIVKSNDGLKFVASKSRWIAAICYQEIKVRGLLFAMSTPFNSFCWISCSNLGRLSTWK